MGSTTGAVNTIARGKPRSHDLRVCHNWFNSANPGAAGARSCQGIFVNRLRRRTAAIRWTIAAGVLCGAVGITGAAPAMARPTEAGDTPGNAAGTSGSDRHSTGVSGTPQARRQGSGAASADPSPGRDYPARHARRVSAGTAEPAGPAGTSEPAEPNGTDETHEWHWHWHWPCHIVWPTAGPVPADAGEFSNGVTAFVDLPPTYLPAHTSFSGLAAPPLSAFAVESLGGPPESGAGLDQAPPAPQGQPNPAATPEAPVPAVPLAGGVTPPTAPVPQRPGVDAPPPEGRLGYPAYLRNADFAQVAAVALPGLAAILGVTALGGFLGYRQAKAGFVLRAAGTARFLP